MFETFVFANLESSTFKEDSVRELIITPILQQIGYQPSGHQRVIRSKALAHPFVMIGSKRHPVTIVPDYTLYLNDKALMILDAKAPTMPIVKSSHVEQAYSYAIHPEVKVKQYGLCNGRELVVYGVDNFSPIIQIPIPEVDVRWTEVVKALDPRYLEQPELRDFAPDYGLAIYKAGIQGDVLQIFPGFYLQDINRVADNLYTGCSTVEIENTEYLVSFDFNQAMYKKFISHLPGAIAQEIESNLSRQPYRADLSGKVIITCKGHLGVVTKVKNEEFIPIIVTSVDSAIHDPSVELNPPK